MLDTVVISELSRHSIKSQKEEFPDGPYFLIPDDLSALFRKTQRNKTRTFHVLSLAIIARDEDAFIDFVRKAWSVPAFIESKREKYVIHPKANIAGAVRAWRKARKAGAAKAGGEEMARRSKREFWEKFQAIKDRWHGDELSKKLLKESGIAHHDTVRVYLKYTRWEWRRLTDKERARVFIRIAKEVASEQD